jgi:ferritin-like metal-binding protein YciE
MLERQIDRLERYPQVEARLRTHLTEKEAQLERLQGLLDAQGDNPSSFKDTVMAAMANVGAMANAAAGDEVLKNSMGNAAMCAFEIAAYESLLAMGEAAGEAEAIRVLQRSLSEERGMMAWLSENQRGLTLAYMQLRSAGEQAKH